MFTRSPYTSSTTTSNTIPFTSSLFVRPVCDVGILYPPVNYDSDNTAAAELYREWEAAAKRVADLHEQLLMISSLTQK